MRMAASLAEAGVGRAGMRSLDDPALEPDHARLLHDLGIRDAWLARYPTSSRAASCSASASRRALSTRPRYLVADEISTMLDAVTQAHIWHVLLAEVERRGAGMVFVSHSPALTARIATRVVELG